MPKESNYPKGKKKTIKIDINVDFQKEMRAEIKEVQKRYWINNKKKETETEYIQRIQSMLQGIENNNGWISIESEDWLKIHKIDEIRTKYYVDSIDEDYLTICILVTKDGSKEFEYMILSDFLFIEEELKKDGIYPTHYQSIQKPKSPIF